MVIQLVRVSIRPDRRERWLELLGANVASTRNENGCERFTVCEDLETPNTFVLVEQWRDLEAQYDHFRNPKFGELMSSLGEVLAGPPEVAIHEVASTLTLDDAVASATSYDNYAGIEHSP